MEKKLGADAAATGTACLAGTATVKKTTDKLSKLQLFIVKEYKSNFYKVKNTKLIILQKLLEYLIRYNYTENYSTNQIEETQSTNQSFKTSIGHKLLNYGSNMENIEKLPGVAKRSTLRAAKCAAVDIDQQLPGVARSSTLRAAKFVAVDIDKQSPGVARRSALRAAKCAAADIAS